GEVWPLDTLDAARELSRLRKAPSLRAEVLGDFAVVKSGPGDAASLPFFLLRGGDGRWRIDKIGNYKSVKVRHDGTFLLPSLTPYSFAYGASPEDVAPLQEKTLREERGSLRAEIQEIKARIDQSPKDHRLYFELADLYYDRCLAIPYAYELYDKGLALEQGDYRLYLHAARYFEQRKFAFRKSLTCYERAYELNPRSLRALREIAIGYSYFKYYGQAERFLKRALSKKPDDEWLMLYRAINFSRTGKKARALEWLRKAVDHGLPDNYVDYYERQTKTKVDRDALRST
ncbi:MAG: tetratricopeptide repeat protein, partial [Vicinamibacteria bacterium]|nr:tetratricopeptide repeat protein [Vicinamibacteria bacterium]